MLLLVLGVKNIWDMLELPKKISIKDEKGLIHKDYPMWIYWFLQEGVLGVDPNLLKDNAGKMPPVIPCGQRCSFIFKC